MQKSVALATMIALGACNPAGEQDVVVHNPPVKTAAPMPQARSRESKLTFSHPLAYAEVGGQLAVSGDLVATGAAGEAPSYSGAVYVHALDPATNAWVEQTRIVPAPADGALHFGRAIAIDGTTVAASSATQLYGGVQHAGAVYVFRGDTGTWLGTRLTDTITDTGGDFGTSLALHGDLLVVGAQASTGEGSVMMFQSDPVTGAWNKVATIAQADAGDTNGAGDHFGAAVALDGDDLLIGAPPDNEVGNVAGAAYVFHRDAVDRDHWALTGTLQGSAGTGLFNPMFGQPVTLHDGVAAVGVADDLWVDGVKVSGSIQIFRPDATGTWTRTKTVISLDAAAGDKFGAAFAFAGDVLVVGAPGKQINFGGQGAAYVFHRDDSTTDAWYQAVRFAASDGAILDGFGSAIAIHDQTAFVGAPHRKGDTGTVLDDFGMVYADDITPPPPRQCQPASSPTATLEDGGSVVAPSGATLAAPAGSLTGPISVWISDVAAPTDPAPATVVGGYVNLGSQCNTIALPEHRFTLSFPVPASADPSLLTVAYQTPTELVLDAPRGGYLWDFVDGSYDATTGQYTVVMDSLVSQGMTYVLVERAAPLPAARLVNAALPSTCGDIPHPDIVCHTTPDLCGDGPLTEGFDDAYRKFQDEGFIAPWLDLDPDCRYTVHVYNRNDPTTGAPTPQCHPKDKDGNPLPDLEALYKLPNRTIVVCPTTAGYSTDKLHALAAHELFHAFQTAYLVVPGANGPVGVFDVWVFESMAEAAVNSDSVMMRDPLVDNNDTLRSVTPPLPSDGDPAYFAQDFWVYMFNATPDPAHPADSTRRTYPLSYFADFLLTIPTTHGIEQFMQISPKYRLLGYEYWAWAKNQVYEKTDVTFGGRLTNPCTLETTLIDTPVTIDYPTHNCASVSVTGLQTKAAVIHVGGTKTIKSLVVDARIASDAAISFKVYKNGEPDCVGALDSDHRGKDGKRTVTNVAPGTDVTVLVSNLSSVSTGVSPPSATVMVGNDPNCH